MGPTADYVQVVDLLVDAIKELNHPCGAAPAEYSAAEHAATKQGVSMGTNASTYASQVQRMPEDDH